MILGILSDTHGQAGLTASAVRVLQAAGAEAFVHCGDVGGAAVLEQLAGLKAWFVWGNTDEPGPLLTEYVQALGLPLPAEVPLRLDLAGRSISVFHGHEPEFRKLTDAALAGQVALLQDLADGADYILFGHTHLTFDERLGAVRVINPGSIHRVRTPSVATLDLEEDTVRFWQVRAVDVGQRPELVALSDAARG